MAYEEQLKVYAPDELVVTFGPVIVKGFVKGTFIRVEHDADITEDEAGIDGEVVVTRSGDRRATVTLTLQQTANSNAELSTFATLAKESPGMAGAIQPFAIADLNGTFILEATNAWIMADPTAEFAERPSPKEWRIRLASAVRVDGSTPAV